MEFIFLFDFQNLGTSKTKRFFFSFFGRCLFISLWAGSSNREPKKVKCFCVLFIAYNLCLWKQLFLF